MNPIPNIEELLRIQMIPCWFSETFTHSLFFSINDSDIPFAIDRQAYLHIIGNHSL